MSTSSNLKKRQPPTTSNSLSNFLQNHTMKELPSDVLQKIFPHCLPQHPLDDVRQPDVTIAPMVLLSVCSSWRLAALTCPSIWTHLSCQLTMFMNKHSYKGILFVKRQIEFLRCRRQKQGVNRPYLSIGLKRIYVNNLEGLKGERLIISAQYLDIDAFFWAEISERYNQGSRVSIPLHHTLVQRMFWTDDELWLFDDEEPNLVSVASFISPQSKLRHLYITGHREYGFMHNEAFPAQWSTLTHIILCNVTIYFTFWFSMLHVVPYLQWGYFEIDGMVHSKPFKRKKFIHRCLSVLYIVYHDRAVGNYDPLAELFENLLVPALRTLSLSSNSECCLDDPNHIRFSYRSPFGTDTPRLSHLRIQAPSGVGRGLSPRDQVDIFLQNLLAPDNKWLDLSYRGIPCPIRRMTLITDDAKEEGVVEFATARFGELAPRTSFIDFQITTESETHAARDEWKKWVAVI
ncbi:hypothetical protein BDN70DRAFT_901040 [Pholiota conissans]|uniref:F-box domain-containing protein n=1 Tax=Pholiota conissans TaxID=109636 RepID=A0A9P5YMZ7_9AGAR|nr:hypothetical protein BDN70DRAFT_901040 [Pholiota conissans]